jgi:carbon monoxide dehydrogenase subunit G
MKIGGVLTIARPAQQVHKALHDPAVLQRMLPACEGVDMVGPGRFRARIARKVGPMTLRVEPDIVLVPAANGRDLDLTVEAAGRIVGSLSATMTLTMQDEPGGMQLAWDGQMTTTGLAQRLLSERMDQVEARFNALFSTLKQAVEGG